MSAAPIIAPIADPELQPLLDRAARMQRRINFRKQTDRTLQARLEKLKAEIALRIPQAPAAAEAARETKGGGTSWTFAAARDATVRVTQPAAKLLSRISGPLVATLKNLVGKKFSRLFIPHYTCAENFRALAFEHLPNDTARELISLVEEPSKTSVTIS